MQEKTGLSKITQHSPLLLKVKFATVLKIKYIGRNSDEIKNVFKIGVPIS